MIDLDLNFPRYTAGSPEVPIWCLTQPGKNLIHRFFDTQPLSPSGRYLAVFQLPEHGAAVMAELRRNSWRRYSAIF